MQVIILYIEDFIIKKLINIIFITYKVGFIFPLSIFSSVYDITPMPMPSAMEKRMGIVTIIRHADIFSIKLNDLKKLQFLSMLSDIINSTALVAALGIICSKGLRNKVNANSSPVTQVVRPVLPPLLMPLMLSRYIPEFDVPRTPPMIVATAMDSSGLLQLLLIFLCRDFMRREMLELLSDKTIIVTANSAAIFL